MYKSIIIVSIILIFTGCTTFRRALNEARSVITELERSDAERAARNAELERLYNAERIGNQELERIITAQQSKLDEYLESERERLERERQIADSLSGIFSEGSDIIEKLIGGYGDLRETLFPTEAME